MHPIDAHWQLAYFTLTIDGFTEMATNIGTLLGLHASLMVLTHMR